MSAAAKNLVTLFNQLATPIVGDDFFSLGVAQQDLEVATLFTPEIRADNIPIPMGLMVPSVIHRFVSENNLPVANIATGGGSIVISLGTITPDMEDKIASLLG